MPATTRTAQGQGRADRLHQVRDLARFDHVDDLAAAGRPAQDDHADHHQETAQDQQGPCGLVQPAGQDAGRAFQAYAGLGRRVHHHQAVAGVAQLARVPVEGARARRQPEGLPARQLFRGDGARAQFAGHRQRAGAQVDRGDRDVRDVGQVAVDRRGRGDAQERRCAAGLGGQAQAGVAEPDERGVLAEQPVEVVDDQGVPGCGHALQVAGEGAARVAVLHGGPECGPHQQRR
ncbi:hypothetical protein AB0C12_37385 [Actinoplanes sp. NPDC048967]|uniref:hypothetical protein n=1 Tax=Actinoplanes sp. NPDC048967 TaxID=3155269 RepID=UPI0033E99171